jgi:SPP1 gp7 family putative phage head morphogenesis protein
MNNGEYWQKRFELLEQAAHQQGVQCYADIEKQYRQAQKQLEGQIAAWYQRFASNNGVTLAEAKRMLNAKELAELKWDVNQYIQYGQENAINGTWVKQLENASARFHISRLEALKLQTQQSIEVMFGNQLDSIDNTMRNVYKSGYYHAAYEIQKGVGVGWDFSALDDKQISKVINKPWAVDGKNFSERIWGNRQKLVNELNNTLTQNIILGKDPQKAIDEIARKMNTSKINAGRLVMTEEAFFSSAAQKDCFTELDVEQFEIVATLDSHTSDICRGMDGKHFPMSEWKVGVTAPPFHVHCRSTTVPYFDDEFDAVGERAARGADGKTYYVPADMTYEQWSKKFVKSAPLEDIRTPVDVEFDMNVSGYKGIQGGCTVKSGGEKYGQEVKIVTLNKRNTTEWDELPAEMKAQLQYTSMGNKPFSLAKGDYEVQRYVEGSAENADRDEIAKALGGDYLGFSFQRKNNQPLYIDFYQKGDDVFYSVGKAQVDKTVKDSSLKLIDEVATEREKLIIENIGDGMTKELSVRSGDEWVSAMKEFHRSIQADGLPTILSDADYNTVQSPVLYRGIAPQSKLRSDITTTSTTKEMADEFFKGDSPFPSRGVYGDGVAYASPAYSQIAVNYATNGGKQMHGGVIIEFKLKADAKVITYEDALEIFRKMTQRGGSKLLFNPKQQKAVNKEVGKAMNALGYDAIIKHNGDNTGQDFYVILNRASLVAKNKYITKTL